MIRVLHPQLRNITPIKFQLIRKTMDVESEILRIGALKKHADTLDQRGCFRSLKLKRVSLCDKRSVYRLEESENSDTDQSLTEDLDQA